MTKKGLTLVELVVSIAVLGIIMAAVASLFSVAINNYQFSFTQSTLQRETNFVIDNITRDIKQSVEIPKIYGGINRGSEKLILALPAVDVDENFLYDGSSLKKDYVIYYLDGTSLRKSITADPSSKRVNLNGTDRIILENVSSLSFSYIPNILDIETTQVDVNMTVTKNTNKATVTIGSDVSAVKRNYE